LKGISPKVSSVNFLEGGAEVPFIQKEEKLKLTLPEKAINQYNTVIKITLEEALTEK